MKIRSQVGMVLNLDKYIGCHTCSATCKNAWTSREDAEHINWLDGEGIDSVQEAAK